MVPEQPCDHVLGMRHPDGPRGLDFCSMKLKDACFLEEKLWQT